MKPLVATTSNVLPKRTRPSAAEVREFVRNSALLADARLVTAEDWDQPEVSDHLMIAKILFLEGHNFLKVELINSALTRSPNNYFRRGGNEHIDDEETPKGKIVERLSRLFDRFVQRRMLELADASEEAKVEFAWLVHHHVRKYRLFASGNSRTARIHMNQVRVMLGLQLLIIKVEDAREYKDRYRRFVHEHRRARKRLALAA